MVKCTTVCSSDADAQEVYERHILPLRSGGATIFVIVVASVFVFAHAMTMIVRSSRRFTWRRERDVNGNVAVPDTERS